MHARAVYTWGGKGVLFREVSSAQGSGIATVLTHAAIT